MMETTSTASKFVYPSADIAKFLCAILVIGIHTEPFAFNFLLDKGFGLITRLAVPFFLLSSSYFLFRKRNEDKIFSIKPYIFRVIKFYFFWSLIYLPIRIYGWVEGKTSFNEITVLYIKDIFINGTYPHLWFLPALIIGVILVGALLRFCEIEVIVSISLILFFIGIMFSTYLPLIENTISGGGGIIDYIGTRNGIFYGFVYVALGAWLSMRNSIVERVDMRKWIVGFFLSMFALGVESVLAIFFIETQATILWFSVIPATICFFVITLKINVINESSTTILFRKASILMYASHYLFIVLFMSIFKHVSDSVIYHPLLFMCVSVTTIALSIIIVNASNRVRLLNNLY